MKSQTRLLTTTLLSLLLIAGCDTKSTVQKSATGTPPIEVKVIAPAVAKQLTNRFGDRFVRVGNVRYTKTETVGFTDSPDCYHVEFFYKDVDQEKRYVMEMGKVTKEASPNLVTYECEIPVTLFGNDPVAGDKKFRVTIDNMMNEVQGNQQKPEGDESTASGKNVIPH